MIADQFSKYLPKFSLVNTLNGFWKILGTCIYQVKSTPLIYGSHHSHLLVMSVSPSAKCSTTQFYFIMLMVMVVVVFLFYGIIFLIFIHFIFYINCNNMFLYMAYNPLLFYLKS